VRVSSRADVEGEEGVDGRRPGGVLHSLSSRLCPDLEMSSCWMNPAPKAPVHLPLRGNPSSGVWIRSSQPTVVLLTVTTEGRRRWLACAEAQAALQSAWSSATAWLVGDYVLLPDHLHCFCAPHDPGVEIEHWITFWKRQVARIHCRADWRFQSRGWHHTLRSGESHTEKWDYMRNNPVRLGLVPVPDAWPYAGRVHELRW
jgi:putative transposase